MANFPKIGQFLANVSGSITFHGEAIHHPPLLQWTCDWKNNDGDDDTDTGNDDDDDHLDDFWNLLAAHSIRFEASGVKIFPGETTSYFAQILMTLTFCDNDDTIIIMIVIRPQIRHRHSWTALVQISGPSLSPPFVPMCWINCYNMIIIMLIHDVDDDD